MPESSGEVIAGMIGGVGGNAARMGKKLTQKAVSRAAGAADDLLISGGKRIGEAGSKPSIRVVEGNATAAEDLFSKLAKGGTDITPSGHPGKLVRLPGERVVGFRPVSKSGPPTVDVNIPGLDIEKIKFVQ
ncbi:MAG: hypothetical protein GY722_29650 [bacterium]|nr:hypothetical protein [bacterium]